MPPDKAKVRPRHHNEDGPNDQMADQTTNTTPTIARRTDKRSTPDQQSLLRGAYVHEPKPGCRFAMILPWDHCPVCGYQNRHNGDWPPPAKVWKSCTLCGYRDEFTLFAVSAIKATKTGRRRRVAA